MKNTVVVGAQFGDEGKAKITDLLAMEADFITRFQGGSNAGHTVVANGKKEILSVKIKPDVVDPDDIETLEDLVMVAVNDAIKKADDMMSEGMNSVTGGLNIPGLF